MWKRILGTLLVAGVGYFAYEAYRDYYRLGWDTRPEMPNGAFSISFKSGFRAILVGIPEERDTRRYLGFPVEVPFYLEKAWSFCNPPTEEEAEGMAADFMADRGNNPGERIEAFCRIKIDDEDVFRGLITSVPKL